MRIGVPAEINDSEFRGALMPSGVGELSDCGHEVIVQVGVASRSPDTDYASHGAMAPVDADAALAQAELIVRVKESQPAEVSRLREHHTLFHLPTHGSRR